MSKNSPILERSLWNAMKELHWLGACQSTDLETTKKLAQALRICYEIWTQKKYPFEGYRDAIRDEADEMFRFFDERVFVTYPNWHDFEDD